MADSVAEAFSKEETSDEKPKFTPEPVTSKNTTMVRCPNDRRELFPEGQEKGLAVANRKDGDGGGYRCTACGKDGHAPAKVKK